MHLTEQAITENLDVLFYLEGKTESGESMYAYVTIAPDNVPEFLEKSRKYGFRPGDYGKVVLSGQGRPSDEDKDHLEEELGLEHGIL